MMTMKSIRFVAETSACIIHRVFAKYPNREGGSGLILPNKKDPRADIPTSEYWVGKISEIRARPETGHVNMFLRGFYACR